jgi:hypothetical protein
MATVCSNCDLDGKYYIGDIGTEIIVDTCVDLVEAGAIVTNLIVEKPDRTVEIWAGSIYGTTSIKYVVQVGDFDQAGPYRIQAYVEMSGWTGRGNTATFQVTDLFG